MQVLPVPGDEIWRLSIVKITDVKLHVLSRETEALVTSLDGLFEDAGSGWAFQTDGVTTRTNGSTSSGSD